MKAIIAVAACLLAQAVSGLGPQKRHISMQKRTEKRSVTIHVGQRPDFDDDPLTGESKFDQLLDHNDISKGTFEQRYWWDVTHWKGPGSPVFLVNGGEDDASGSTGYLYNTTLPGMYAQQFGGAVILIEHRYWGDSIPYKQLTAETLQYLDLPQSIMDMTYFAKNVKLDVDDWTEGANADKAPWVLIGGSYPGALAAWTQILDPGVFWAYHSSSGVVETITHFWQYFAPIEAGIPRNCSSDLKTIINYVDTVLAKGDAKDVADLKAIFNLGQLAHDDDFAEALTRPLWEWQSNQQNVTAMCDYMEYDADAKQYVDDPKGQGLDKALLLFAAWIKATAAETCQQYSCDSYSDTSGWDDPTDLTGNRQWNWMLCHNPFSWWQTGPAKSDGTNIVSTYLSVEHFQRQCALYFPETNGFVSGSQQGFTAEHLNRYTGGWDADFERVIFVNGEFDPWRSASVASESRPGGPRASTATAPSYVIAGGNHCPDLVLADVPPSEQDKVDDIIKTMGGFLSQWKK